MTDAQFDECMLRILKKDKQALKEIYEEYISFIYHAVLDIVGSKENAEDITSEFFIKLWEKAGSYKPGGGHKGYIATIARNMAIDFVRKHKREELMGGTVDEDSPPDEIGTAADPSPTPEDMTVSGITAEQALATLKPVYRQIVIMKVLSEMTFKEIATVLEMPMGTVTWNYQEAIKQLRRFGYD
ncbi:MAG: sigma-70 family RNA polymerase sigma factor [Lachnospiraceae bacterium]|nr:sigma-70 family RNA polymerase sigma factor [Lachnospiraceae bacterium]